MTNVLTDKSIGCLVGAAVGDAMGGPTEGSAPDAIQARYGGFVLGVVGPFHDDWRTARPISPYHKGDGHVTDDTLMIHAMVRVYDRCRRHLTAFDIDEFLVPDMMEERRWIPEFEDQALLLQRVFLAEKWLALRLHYGHNDPREAGVGNMVNCGAAMYMAPVGLVNAGDPERAYAEAIDLAGAHQSSYGREAAGVYAAAVASACTIGATPASIMAVASEFANDGTRSAIEHVGEAVGNMTHWKDSLGAMRDAVRPFDTVADTYREPGPTARRPSRVHSIEELPVALGFLVLADANYEDTVLGAVNYGRDADSIAMMGGSLAGALGGRAAVPDAWASAVASASQMDLEKPGRLMAEISQQVRANDLQAARKAEADFEHLLDDAPD